jgi:hypothetical protein
MKGNYRLPLSLLPPIPPLFRRPAAPRMLPDPLELPELPFLLLLLLVLLGSSLRVRSPLSP